MSNFAVSEFLMLLLIKNLNTLTNKNKTKSSNFFFSFIRRKQPSVPFVSPIYPL